MAKKCLNCGYPEGNESHHDCCPDGSSHRYALTEREVEVKDLRNKGKTGTEIARKLGITRARVYQVLDSIKQKGTIT